MNKERKRNILTALLLIGVFLASRKVAYLYAYLVFGPQQYRELDHETKTILVQAGALILPLILVLILERFSIKNTLTELGMRADIGKALGLSLLCCSPMYIGNFFASPVHETIEWKGIFTKALWPGFNEELIFRGFLAGQLFRRAKWGFIPSSLVSALYFGWGHLYQSNDLASAISIFIVTALAGTGFTVFFMEFKWNIWWPMFLHVFMNMHTVFFDTGGTAALNPWGNFFRILTIAAAVFFTVKAMSRQGSVIRGNLWINKSG